MGKQRGQAGGWVTGTVMGVLVGLLLLATGPAVWAQSGETRGGARAAEDGPAAEEGGKKRTEPRGRLPAHWGEVIDSQQRDKIYGIQARYLAEIKQLQDQIVELERKRAAEVQSVLTPEQAEKVRQLVETAKTKRSEGAKKKKPAAAESAAAEPSSRP